MKARIFILSGFILSFAGINIIPVYSQGATFTQLIESYKNSLEAEERHFNKLTFEIAPEEMQMRKVERLMGLSHKFILKDTQGDYWIFKPASDEIKSVCMYKIFKLLGLDTPQMFWKSLNINGRSVNGSMQRFIPGAETLKNVHVTQLNKESLEYLLHTHILQWFFASYGSGAEHFLTFFEKDTTRKIMRIDTTSCLSLLGKDTLDLTFFPPCWKSYKTGYYYEMWENFINDKIRLDITQSLIFIKFLEKIPDAIIIELITPALKYEFPRQDNMSSYLIKRKHRLFKDFISFYSKIMSKKNSKLALPSHREIEMGIEKIIRNCIKKFEKDILRKESAGNYQVHTYSVDTTINVIASIRGWGVIRKRILEYKIMGENKGEIPLEEYYKMLDELSGLKEGSNNYEKLALDYYAQEVKSLIENKKDITEIERIIKLP